MKPETFSFRSILEKKVEEDRIKTIDQTRGIKSHLEPHHYNKQKEELDIAHRHYRRGINEALQQYCIINNDIYVPIPQGTLKINEDKK